jgi:transposase
MWVMLATPEELSNFSEAQLRELAASLITELRHKQTLITQLTHEMAILKRLKFAAKAERFNAQQRSLLDEDTDADLQGLSDEIDALTPQTTQAPTTPNKQPAGPKRQILPPDLPRHEIRHEPTEIVCGCGCQLKRIGEDVAEKLDYTPGVFSVERHIRGKWVCKRCETLIQAPVPAHVIDKGLPTAGLLAAVIIGKYLDHQPLYRQEGIFARSGVSIARSTMAQWVGSVGLQLMPLVQAMKQTLLARSVLHADETPVAMLDPGAGKTHRAYLWSYCTTLYDPISTVVFDFADSRAGRHARQFLGFDDERPQSGWRGKLVCDDFTGYKALFPKGVLEAGCLADARRKFYDLVANHQSVVGAQALKHFGALYKVEEDVAKLATAEDRLRWRGEHARPIALALREWLIAQRLKVPNGSATARAIDYSLNRWQALTRYIDDGELPADNNRVENLIRPIALGRSNWLFAGSLRAGKRAAAIMSLVHTARINGHDPFVYLKDVLQRLPTHPVSRIEELLPFNWQPPKPVSSAA